MLAGLVAEGYTTVNQIEYIERGYEDFDQKMQALGADIEKIPVEDEKALQKFRLRVG